MYTPIGYMIGTGGEIMDKKDCCCSERHKDRSEEEKKKIHKNCRGSSSFYTVYSSFRLRITVC